MESTVGIGIGDALRRVLQREAGAAHRVIAAEYDAKTAVWRAQNDRVGGARVAADVHRRGVSATCERHRLELEKAHM